MARATSMSQYATQHETEVDSTMMNPINCKETEYVHLPVAVAVKETRRLCLCHCVSAAGIPDLLVSNKQATIPVSPSQPILVPLVLCQCLFLMQEWKRQASHTIPLCVELLATGTERKRTEQNKKTPQAQTQKLE
ncbi:hypothetical protein J3458_004304 [Metarhizium acridum]|uniref:uncharacterized protein n=1 Tax=Metarhizium acridum TaxID=92637 RepID=UPI001C6AA642|nr:hypothetical protein J3458_004304 [Metarhizium acridum]